MERKSNYDRLCLDWQEKFRNMDQTQLMDTIPELKVDGPYLTLLHFGRKYGIHRVSGAIHALEDDAPVTNNEKLNIYTLLGYCKRGARQSGTWLPFRSLRGAGPFAPAFDRNILQPLAATFAGRVAAFQSAAQAIGGLPLQRGDAGALLYAFACIPMQFLFWDGDDEFPAQANILFDSSATDFIHVESTVTLASEGLCRLAQAAGLPLKGDTFAM